MIDSTQMLRSLLRGFRQLSGADGASLFVPATSGPSPLVLLHEGDAPPVAELSAEPDALELHRRFQPADGGFPPRLPGRQPGTWLLPLHPTAEWPGGNGRQPAAWVGLRFAAGEGRSSPLEGREEIIEWLCRLGGVIASHAKEVARALRDPVTGLPDRIALQSALSAHLGRARRLARPLALLFINPDDFAVVNERFGRQAGDLLLLEISRRLRAAFERSDPLARYGGAIFAAVLPDMALGDARSAALAALPQLSEAPYQEGALRLGFSIGVAVAEPAAEPAVDELELVRRADKALDAAKRQGGGSVADWQGDSEPTGHGVDRLSGIFTGNMAKDYRNMILLSDALEVIAEQSDFDGLAGEVVERLYAGFRPERVALFERDGRGELHLVKGVTRSRRGTGGQSHLQTVELEPPLRDLLRQAALGSAPLRTAGGDDPDDRLGVALPLRASEQTVGVLFLDGPRGSLALDSSDLMFLRALAAQLAVALDRARLSEAERQRQGQESQRLRSELNELRQALQQAKLVYRSGEMERLLTAARRVAPTDATVLISGESGTGKELLARTLHELGPRRDVPMVVVDCGAIAPSLIESELFGHERGAYTGAENRRIGRLAEANGGTILLDEVSELPLEIQSRLLRFVQEKQVVAVGGQRPSRVDVRILAATNRDLAREVAQGRFREDLFHRLNVFRLEIPPLRERPDDIGHLARYFLEIYSLQYQKHIRRLASDAEEAILAYPWPGNVRELQNRIMQGVILCEGDELGLAELQLPVSYPDGAGEASATDPAAAQQRTAGSSGRPWAIRPRDASRRSTPTSPTTLSGDPVERLRVALALQVEAALATRSHEAFPLGKWLGEDLVLEAHAAADGVSRRAALLAGLPETTFRRRLRRALDRARAGFSPRTGNWDQVRSALADVVRELGQSDRDLLALAQRVLLEEIVARVPGDTATGAKLLGVTPPTFRVRAAHLTES